MTHDTTHDTTRDRTRDRTRDIRQLGPGDLPLLHALLCMFGRAFGEVDTYTGRPPGDAYLRRLLGGPTFIAPAAVEGEEVVGGLAAYALPKFERERTEILIYDLAVAAEHRRRGVASALIQRARAVAAERGAHALFVQADTAPEDAPAIALYSTLAAPQPILHFDIPVPGADATG